MNYLFVVFTLCVAGTDQCETHRIPAYGVNELTCMSQAQAIVAKNMREGFEVKRFGCEKED